MSHLRQVATSFAPRRFGLRLLRVTALILLAALGSTLLLRLSPGYFVEEREMDAAHAQSARTEVQSLRAEQDSVPHLLRLQLGAWVRGDLGRSRHYGLPVSELLRARAGTTARLLSRGLFSGWLCALALALPLSSRRTARGEVVIAGTTSAFLAIPVGVLATVSLLLNQGGPVLVLTLLVAVRDFKLLYRLLRSGWAAPHLLHARAGGLTFARTLRAHLLPVLGAELLAIAMMSLIIALSALVPVEVIFDVPGLGQLAWSAATNRDLPVLVAVTALLAFCVGMASLFAQPGAVAEDAACV